PSEHNRGTTAHSSRKLLATRSSSESRLNRVRGDGEAEFRSIRWAWLLVVPFVAFALVSACLPPGTLLPAESQGYDVLEYHLAAPKQYFVQQRITYLPHNIYSNLPFNAEMLYLLAMILRGGPVEGVLAAQFVHTGLGVLAVAAVWLAARPFGRGAATMAGIAAATCPIVAHLAGIAYDENGLVAMTAATLACVLRIRAGEAGNED